MPPLKSRRHVVGRTLVRNVSIALLVLWAAVLLGARQSTGLA